MQYQNNFGFLRLLLASLVIFSHSPELIDGNRSNEILTQIFGSISLGELAVGGFFLISGYLILKSFESSASLKVFLTKRVLRIFPGFIAASLFCFFIVAPLSGGFGLLKDLASADWLKFITGLLILDIPLVNGAFATNAVKSLNGSMWTIWLEFLCYLSIPAFAFLGLYKRKLFVAALIGVAIIYLSLMIFNKNIWIPYPFRISANDSSRLLLTFMAGSVFHIYRDKIKWSHSLSALALVILTISLYTKPHFAQIGLLTCGSYLLFNFALNFKNKFLNQIGQRNDVSYGVYLYAWPVQSLIIQYYPNIKHLHVSLITLVISLILGYLSWSYIEKPFAKMKLKL